MSFLEEIEKAACRKSFETFLSRIDIPGTPSLYAHEEERFIGPAREVPLHHKKLARVLQLAVEGEIERFMVFMPPGTAKSTVTSVCLPSWAMGRDPLARIILTSYGTKLARKMSRRTRSIVRSRGYRSIFNATLSRESSGVEEWATNEGAEMIACGIDAGVVGNRATLALYDDPFKSRKQAESPTIRQNVRQAIEDDLATRLVPGGAMGGIFTRYVMDDPATWFLGEDYAGQSGFITGTDGLKYFVLNCPAECESEDDPLGREIGEYIWPERFSPAFWAPHKRIARKWSSLFQQRPAPKAGIIFKREWFQFVRPDEVPKYATRCRGWDFGATEEEENKTADSTSGTRIDKAGDRLFIRDVVNQQTSAAAADMLLKQCIQKDPPGTIVSIPQDPGQAGKDQAQRRVKFARAAGASDVRCSPESGGKIYRADTLSGEAERGNVFVVMGDWQYERFINQLCEFPVGAHDDDVDSASRACNELINANTIRRVKVKVG